MSLWLIYFTLTFALELPIVYLFFRKESFWNIFFFTLGVNLITHPIAFYTAWNGLGFYWVEGGVLIVETILWRLLLTPSWSKAFIVALVSNAVTAYFPDFLRLLGWDIL